MSTRKTISRLATIGGLCTAVALTATACGAGGPASSGSAASSVNVLVEAGGHAELAGVAEASARRTPASTSTSSNCPTTACSTGFPANSPPAPSPSTSPPWTPSGCPASRTQSSPSTSSSPMRPRRTSSPPWSRKPTLMATSSACRPGPTPRSSCTARTSSRTPRTRPTSRQSTVTTWPRPPPGSSTRTSPSSSRRTACTAPTSRVRVETEWLAHVLQAGSPMVLDANNNVIIDNAAHKEALDFYTSLDEVRSARRGPGRLGRSPEPVQPGQDRHDPVLGPRLPADPQGLPGLRARSAPRP